MFEVSTIVDESPTRGYRIRWKGYGSEDDTWETFSLGGSEQDVPSFVEWCATLKDVPGSEEEGTIVGSEGKGICLLSAPKIHIHSILSQQDLLLHLPTQMQDLPLHLPMQMPMVKAKVCSLILAQ